ncbi:serine hydrolase domain-containing protein [uncultured Erythrobacter sp.]|uniref:serine hydrolase domain-containing protein n=1 Tax=uncultured Erythrobacter sp. TaxID=263913 RepID=UPI00260CFE03|nr:serine hydrolase domain-containing protein [uncultured Erythrobacter sp.]
MTYANRHPSCICVMARYVFGAASAFTLALCTTQSVASESNPAERIDKFLAEGADNGFSGAILVSVNGNVVLNEGYGLANKEEELPFTPDTVISIGSVTKQFTATAILLLVERSQLSVDDPVSHYFPDLPDNKKNITIHQLLTHSSGLPHSIGDGDFDHIPTHEFFSELFNGDLMFEPGERYGYSNAGYSVLARIIELQSGMDYESFIAHNLFGPAGMKRTGYTLPHWDDLVLAHAYQRNIIDRGTMIERFKSDGAVSWNLKGNGGIHSTQNDMYLWYLALENNTVLSSELTKQLTTSYIAEQESGDSHYGYGWAIFTSDRDTQIITHNGGNGAFFHEFLWLPDDKAVIIFSTNATSQQVERTWAIEKMLFNASFQPEPIIENVYQLVFDFMAQQPPAEITKLKSILRSHYESEISSPTVLNRLGYLSLQFREDKQWAVEIFSFNSQLFPDDPNVWDSLGDGYRANGQKAKAIDAYRSAVRLGSRESQTKINELTDAGVR